MGPGLLESIYESALAIELRSKDINVEQQIQIPVVYKGKAIGLGFRADIIVENKLIVEIKSVKKLVDIHHKQLLTYLKLTDIKLGLLVNFSSSNIAMSIIRIVNRL